MSTPAVGSPGDNKAFLDGTALTFPVVVDGTHDDFKYDTDDYTVASGTFKANDLKALCKALNKSTKSGGAALSAKVVASPSPFTLGAIRFTAATAGVNTKAFATGTSNDLLARLGVSNGAVLAHGAAPINSGRSFSSDLTTNDTAPSAPPVAGNGHPVQAITGDAHIHVDATDPTNPILGYVA